MKRTSQPIDEQTVNNGMRHLGRLIPRGDASEALGADGDYLCKCDTVAEARQPILRADREQGAAASLDDDGAPAA